MLERACSELLLSKAVVEVHKGRAIILLIFLVRESESSLHVVVLPGVDLEFVVPGNDELDSLGGTLLEFRDAVGFAFSLELGTHSGEETLDIDHKVFLGKARELVVAEGVNDVDDSRCIVVLFDDVVRGDHDLSVAFLDVAALDLKDCVIHD